MGHSLRPDRAVLWGGNSLLPPGAGRPIWGPVHLRRETLDLRVDSDEKEPVSRRSSESSREMTEQTSKRGLE